MKRVLLLLVLASLAAVGCTTKSMVEINHAPALRQRAPMVVAVLPFEASSPAVGNSVADQVTVAFMSIPDTQFIERTKVLEFLKQNGTPLPENPWSVRKELVEATGADAFLLGTVSEYRTRSQDFVNIASVDFNARLVDARTGEVLFITSCHKVAIDGEPNFMAQDLAERAVTRLLEEMKQ